MHDKRYPEILEHLTALTSAVLEKRSTLPKREVEELASLIADQIGRDLAGQQVYFGRFVTLSERDRGIYQEFNGANYDQLAYKYQLSERQIRTIISRARAEEIRRKKGAGRN